LKRGIKMFLILSLIIGACIGFTLCALLNSNTLAELREVQGKYETIVRYAREHNGVVHPGLYLDRSVE
jgi:hypothetical protein